MTVRADSGVASILIPKIVQNEIGVASFLIQKNSSKRNQKFSYIRGWYISWK